MTLTPGTRLGAYDILAMIGVGGMGDVFRARDTRLQRDIALKVLPDSFVRDPDRLARFRREALVLAALNHPNVAAIFGVEESTDTLALVLELVDGPTLADRIEQRPLPLDEALPIAAQIADALEAAHEQGVVHRDLKPANIKIRPDGTVKVLDFGLAKALDAHPTSVDAASGPTITSPALMTAAGVLLGTAAYMSPEQAKGRPADRRSDIWAFGVVLFEMLSGRRPFKGDDVADTLAAVLRAEPAWNELPAITPMGVRRLLRRCLQKDSRRRLQHIGDARLELADVGLEESTPPVRVAPLRRPIWPIIAAATAGGVAVGAALWVLGRGESVRPVTRFPISVPELAARAVGQGSSVTLSPDGQTIVYVVGGPSPGLEKRRLNEMRSERIRGAEGGTRPFFSPDGEWIGFIVGTKLRKVPVAGGSPIPICEVGTSARASWGDDGTIVVARPSLWKVPAGGGRLQPLIEAGEGVGQFIDPYVLPGSRAVLVQNRQPPSPGFIEAIDLQTRTRHRLVEGSSGRLTTAGELIFVRQSQMWAARFDATRLAMIGSAVPVFESASFGAEGLDSQGGYATSNNGSLVYLAGSATTSLGWLDRKGVWTTLADGITDVRNPRLSPDGTRIAVNGGANPANVYVFEVGRPGSRLPLTTSGHNRIGAWSRDGQQIAFFSALMTPQASLGVQDLFVVPASGGTPTRVLERPGAQWADSWSPDGRFLIFDDGPGYSRDLWVLPLGGEPRRLVADPKFNERGGAFSPDGKSFAFVSDMSGRAEVYVEPFPGPGERVPISIEGGLQPVWSRDGRELFYRQGDALMAVPVQFDPFRPGAPRKHLDMPRALYGQDPYVPEYDVAADGRVVTVRRDTVPEIHVVLNWAEELRRALGR